MMKLVSILKIGQKQTMNKYAETTLVLLTVYAVGLLLVFLTELLVRCIRDKIFKKLEN